jgi:hypothetical protein
MTIGYNRLGSNGRLGNQMFQYAGLRGIAAHRGFDWTIPEPVTYGDSNYGLFDCFKMSSVKEENFGLIQGESLQTGCFHFNQDAYDKWPDATNLHDYFQTEKYFKNVEEDIRKDFTFKNDIMAPCLEVMNEYEDPIFIHVRRGDYVNQPENHPALPVSYYKNALEKHFKDDQLVFVFSDDLDWCRENFKDDRFLISTENPLYEQTADTNDGRVKSFIPYYDLCMMSLCTGGIIANSSMSWWGAWLINHPTSPIVAPTPWFGVNYSHYNMNDLIPESWIVESIA